MRPGYLSENAHDNFQTPVCSAATSEQNTQQVTSTENATTTTNTYDANIPGIVYNLSAEYVLSRPWPLLVVEREQFRQLQPVPCTSYKSQRAIG